MTDAVPMPVRDRLKAFWIGLVFTVTSVVLTPILGVLTLLTAFSYGAAGGDEQTLHLIEASFLGAVAVGALGGLLMCLPAFLAWMRAETITPGRTRTIHTVGLSIGIPAALFAAFVLCAFLRPIVGY